MFNDFGIVVLPLTEAEMGLLAATRRSTRLRMPDAIVVCLAQREGAAVASFDDRLTAKAIELGLPTYPKNPPG
jgi:predicted nucleic acid-binding protein